MVCESSQGIYFFMFLVFDTQKSGKCKIIYRFFVKYLAEREGFEPSVPVRVQRFSRPSRSATPASFLFYKTLSEWMAWLRFVDLNT